MKRTKIVFVGAIFGIIALFSSCVEEQPKVIPDVFVDITINLDEPLYNHLNSINNAIKYPNQGYGGNGVIIYRYTYEDYLAFDATCPQHIANSTSINLDDGGSAGTGTCPHCKTVYHFANFGLANKGYPLKLYSVSLNGRMLRVTN